MVAAAKLQVDTDVTDITEDTAVEDMASDADADMVTEEDIMDLDLLEITHHHTDTAWDAHLVAQDTKKKTLGYII